MSSVRFVKKAVGVERRIEVPKTPRGKGVKLTPELTLELIRFSTEPVCV